MGFCKPSNKCERCQANLLQAGRYQKQGRVDKAMKSLTNATGKMRALKSANGKRRFHKFRNAQLRGVAFTLDPAARKGKDLKRVLQKTSPRHWASMACFILKQCKTRRAIHGCRSDMKMPVLNFKKGVTYHYRFKQTVN